MKNNNGPGIDRLSVEILEACMDANHTEILSKRTDAEVGQTDCVRTGQLLLGLLVTSPGLVHAIRGQLRHMIGANHPTDEQVLARIRKRGFLNGRRPLSVDFWVGKMSFLQAGAHEGQKLYQSRQDGGRLIRHPTAEKARKEPRQGLGDDDDRPISRRLSKFIHFLMRAYS